MSYLNSFGWNSFYEKHFTEYKSKGFAPARVSSENKTNYLVITEYGEITAEISGKFLYQAETTAQYPKTGDWVVASLHNDNTLAIIHDILPRRTKISRKSSDRRTNEQIMAVNTDIVFIMQSLDNNLNINRLRRTLVAMNESGAEVVILLSKTDLNPDSEKVISDFRQNFPDNGIIAVSSVLNSGIEEIRNKFGASKTGVVIGSSGVGKSTLINKLLGQDLIKAAEVRSADSKGKHTTTRRELFMIPGGGLIIDTPGIRELALWNAEEGLSKTFSHFEDLAERCYFTDCTHIHESRCAVLDALERGELTAEEYNNYLKLRKELRYLESRQDKFLQIEEKRKWKSIHKELKHFNKRNRT